jgi:hypothetical protein
MNLLLRKSAPGSLRDSALKNTTKALIGLLAGENRGKWMVKLQSSRLTARAVAGPLR